MLRFALPGVFATMLALSGCGARTTLRVPGEGGDADANPPDVPPDVLNDRAEDAATDPPVDPRPDPPADPMGDPPPPPVWSGITNVSVSASTVDSEPSIAVNDRGEVVVGWMRIIGGSSQLIYAATAHDGRTFGAPFILRDLDSVDYPGGDDDISFASGPSGVLHAAWLGVVGYGASGTFWSDIRYAVSMDGGDTWTHSVVVSSDMRYGNDRPWIAVSPSGDAYVIFNQIDWSASNEYLVIARLVAGAWTLSTFNSGIASTGFVARDGGALDVPVYEIGTGSSTSYDLYLVHFTGGGALAAWQQRVATVYDMSWSPTPCVPGSTSITDLPDGRRQILYVPTLFGEMILRSALFDASGMPVGDFEVTRASNVALSWVDANASGRTGAIWITSGFGSLYGISSAVFTDGIATSIDPIPGTASAADPVWGDPMTCRFATGTSWPGHYIAVTHEGDEFLAAWSDAHSGNEEVYVARRVAP